MKKMYLIIFNHTNGTSFLRGNCQDLISLFNKLEKLMNEADIEDVNKEIEFNENFEVIGVPVFDGIYNIYQVNVDSLLNISLL